MSDALITARENKRMFNKIARRYDLLNRVLSFGLDLYWRRRAIEELGPDKSGEYIDVGCGPGDMAIEICRQAPGARVVGVDPSVEMLKMGECKIGAAGVWDNIFFSPQDALSLSYDDEQFAGACSAFCLRNVEDRRRALAEMHRVIQPGGRASVLELTKPRSRLLKVIYRIYSRVWVPLVGKILSRSGAYQYLVDSIQHFPSEAEILEHMNAIGYVNTRAVRMTGGIATIFVGEKATGRSPHRSQR